MNRGQRIKEALSGGRGSHWHPTDALVRGAALGVGLVVVGGLIHRVELVLFGAPLLVSTLIALVTKVGGKPVVTVRGLSRTGARPPSARRVAFPDDHAFRSAGNAARRADFRAAEPRAGGEPSNTVGAAKSLVEVDAGDGAEVIAIRLPVDEPGPGPVHLLPATTRSVEVVLRRDSWGEGVDLRPDHLVAGPDGLLVFGPVTAAERGRVILPPVHRLPAGLLPARARGLVGAHRARRPGDSVELRDIRAFQPGDRLRRVDWRVSLRAGALHVREHHAEADADVVLALDTRFDVDQDVGSWSVATQDATTRDGGSLDLAVRAAASLAAGYLRQGDRVGLVDLGRPELSVRPGAGRRQLLRLRNQLVVCARSAGWAQRPVLRREQLPHGALVVVLSPFLDADVAELSVHAARRGHVVLAVDVLPSDLKPDRETPWGAAALRVLQLEHEVRMEAMRRHGVAVVTWDPRGAAISTVLREAARPGVRR